MSNMADYYNDRYYLDTEEKEIEREKDHSNFLERLLTVLYGEGWEKLTIYEAKEWHKKHFKE